MESYEELWDRIRPMSPEEQAEQLLNYWSVILGGMTDEQLRLYHRHVISRQNGSREEAMMLEIVEGQTALRQIRQS